MRAIPGLCLLAAVGCGHGPTAREQILAVLPAQASAVFVADGRSLAHARLRPVIEALRPRWPAKLGCVIDAGLAADEVGIATTSSGTSIVLISNPTARPSGRACPALSQRSPGVWVATIGDGVFASATVPSVKDDPRFARARAHLLSAPIGAMLESTRFQTSIHASAQPEPLEAWVAFDAEPAVAEDLERGVRAIVDRMTADATTSKLAARTHVQRDGTQVTARIEGAVAADVDLGVAAMTLVAWGWGQTRDAPASPGWTCPPASELVVGCSAGSTLEVKSLREVARTISTAPLAPVVSNGNVAGLRFGADLPTFGLQKGDLVFACEGRPLLNQAQLVDCMMQPPMRKALSLVASLALSLTIVACHGSDPTTGGAGSASAPATTPRPDTGGGSAGSSAEVTPAGSGSAAGSAAVVADKLPEPPEAKAPPVEPAAKLDGHDFTAEAKMLLAIGACGEGTVPDGFDLKVLGAHCDIIKKAQADYIDAWVKLAKPWFAAHVPKDVPKKVVYPFAGGDLSTALTVYPDADEITTMSLEPAGDPRDLGALKGKELQSALGTIEYELKFLYRVNFSNTLNMIDAMRGGKLPTNLVFSLSALKIHGYEVVSLRYFRFNEDGTLHYLDDAEVARAPAANKAKAEVRNAIFSNIELQFRKPGGRIQTYRHVRQNLDNDHLKKQDLRVLKYLQGRGTPIATMTKAASYLLSWESFSVMRDFILSQSVWMVSDATGVAPMWGKPKGFEYETYGGFVAPHIPAGTGIAKDWKTEFEAQPKRELPFRFGYYDKHETNHLIIMRKK
ncbi:MAG: hypothetical protein NT062_22825 [Proteobacteria bacterium]|nr:hypothetical protein [Pseudomonadota bacterium]